MSEQSNTKKLKKIKIKKDKKSQNKKSPNKKSPNKNIYEINKYVQKHIDDIKWEDTITLFQDLNSIIFIYNEKVPTFNTTKKVRIGKKRRKTKRKFT